MRDGEKEILAIEQTSSNLPEAQVLQQYHDIAPELMYRMVAMGERALEGKIALDAKRLHCDAALRKAGQRYGTAICLFAMGMATILALKDHTLFAGTIFGVVTTSIIVSIITRSMNED